MGARGPVDMALNSISKGLGFDFQYQPRVEVSGKF